MYDQVIIKASAYSTSSEVVSLSVDASNTNYDSRTNPQTVLSGGSVRLAYNEPKYFWLDDTFLFPKDNTVYPAGWISSAVANASGVINQKLTIINQFGTSLSSYGVTLNFDKDSIPVNFTIVYYKNASVVSTRTVAGNTSSVYQDLTRVNEWNKLVITVTKTQANQRARINTVNIHFVAQTSSSTGSQTEVDVINKVVCTKTVDIAAENQAAGTLDFSMLNEDFSDLSAFAEAGAAYDSTVRYDVYLKDSQLPSYPAEYFNTYYTKSKDNYTFSENGTVVSVKAYDGYYWLDKVNMGSFIFLVDTVTVEEVINAISAAANIPIAVEGGFENTVIGKGYIDDCTCREAIRKVCETVGAVCDTEETGLVIKQVPSAETVDATITDDFIVDGSVTTKSNKTSKIKVTGHQYVQHTDYELVAQTQGVEVYTKKRYEIPFEIAPVMPTSIEISSDATVSNIKVHATYIAFDAESTENIQTYFNVEGIPYSDTVITEEYGTDGVIKEIETTLTNNVTRISNFQKFRVMNKRTLSCEIFGSAYKPKMLDVVTLSDDNGEDTIIIESISYTFSDKELSCKIGGRKYGLG